PSTRTPRCLILSRVCAAAGRAATARAATAASNRTSMTALPWKPFVNLDDPPALWNAPGFEPIVAPTAATVGTNVGGSHARTSRISQGDRRGGSRRPLGALAAHR